MNWNTAWRVLIMLELLVLLRGIANLLYYIHLEHQPAQIESTGHCWDEECQG